MNSIDYELWARSEAYRELRLFPEASEDDRLLLPLILSLARLAAQRDATHRQVQLTGSV